jgi:DNA-binding CsgD family transcriptional regulator
VPGKRTDGPAQAAARVGAEGFAKRTRRELLATGATVRKRNVKTRDDLTAQETQLARLARDGLSNPEIGAQLFLSAPAVEWHLRKVFTKLGISSRRQLRAALLDADPPSRVPRADPRKVRWSTAVMSSEIHGRFKRWFWRPPRAHGEVIADRQVSVLELFYDLVYVAVIGQAAHHLAEHVTVRGLAEFAVVFALIWIAWINGSLYLELHGRQDGRTRTVVFVQLVLTERALVDAERLVLVFHPFVWRCREARLRPCWSAGCDRRRGCWRCCWW